MGLLSGILLPHLGDIAGSKVGGFFGGKKGAQIGSTIGKDLAKVGSELIPFKTGGKVKKTGAALLHKNEYVLPANVKPTKAQRAMVAKNKAKARKSKKM